MKKAKRGRAKTRKFALRIEGANGNWRTAVLSVAESQKCDLDLDLASRALDMVAIWAVREGVNMWTDSISRLASTVQTLLKEASDKAFALGATTTFDVAALGTARGRALKANRKTITRSSVAEPRDSRGRRIGKRATGLRRKSKTRRGGKEPVAAV